MTDRPPRGPTGPQGAQGAKGERGIQGVKGDQGNPGTSIFDSAIPSGKTIKGGWGAGFYAGGANDRNFQVVSFPIPAPVALTDAWVKIGALGPDGLENATIASAAYDSDTDSATCSGNYRAPTTPPGIVCVYVRTSNLPTNIKSGSFSVDPLDSDAGGVVNTLGWAWGAEPYDHTVTARIEGTWAYTGP